MVEPSAVIEAGLAWMVTTGANTGWAGGVGGAGLVGGGTGGGGTGGCGPAGGAVAATVTVVATVIFPADPLAVAVYVVVEDGFTICVPPPVGRV